MRTLTSVLSRYLSKIAFTDSPADCWLWTGGTFENGYGRLALDDAQRSSVRSHRWGYTALVGEIPEGLVVRHTCDTPLCHNPDHWILGTNAENSRDMAERLRSLKGITNPAAKLTDEAVREIRAVAHLLPKGKGSGRGAPVTYRSLCEKYGVTYPVIRGVVEGRTWRHVT